MENLMHRESSRLAKSFTTLDAFEGLLFRMNIPVTKEKKRMIVRKYCKTDKFLELHPAHSCVAVGSYEISLQTIINSRTGKPSFSQIIISIVRLITPYVEHTREDK